MVLLIIGSLRKRKHTVVFEKCFESKIKINFFSCEKIIITLLSLREFHFLI